MHVSVDHGYQVNEDEVPIDAVNRDKDDKFSIRLQMNNCMKPLNKMNIVYKRSELMTTEKTVESQILDYFHFTICVKFWSLVGTNRVKICFQVCLTSFPN